jgi:hypothetical protein
MYHVIENQFVMYYWRNTAVFIALFYRGMTEYHSKVMINILPDVVKTEK